LKDEKVENSTSSTTIKIVERPWHLVEKNKARRLSLIDSSSVIPSPLKPVLKAWEQGKAALQFARAAAQ
jgi:hypothetical protein